MERAAVSWGVSASALRVLGVVAGMQASGQGARTGWVAAALGQHYNSIRPAVLVCLAPGRAWVEQRGYSLHPTLAGLAVLGKLERAERAARLAVVRGEVAELKRAYIRKVMPADAPK